MSLVLDTQIACLSLKISHFYKFIIEVKNENDRISTIIMYKQFHTFTGTDTASNASWQAEDLATCACLIDPRFQLMLLYLENVLL